MARWNRAGTLTATVRQNCHQMQHDSLIEPNKILIKEKLVIVKLMTSEPN